MGEIRTADDVKNDVKLCKLHVNMENQKAVASSSGFFKFK